ncbi:MAG: TonB-dependent receptor domain-containing protein [Acidobacteriaceae bacterium]
MGIAKQARGLLLSATFVLSGAAPLLLTQGAHAQATSGAVVGTIADASGAAIPNATVNAVNVDTKVASSTTANASGEYRIDNLLAGRYNISASAPGFSTYTLENFTVQLNNTSTAKLVLPVASAATNVEVSSQAAVAIDTTTIQLQQTFNTKQTQDLPTATIGLGAINLSLLSPGVSLSSGIGAGTGPSVGGQRPRNNNFTIEGIDDNDKGVTGPLITIPNDATGEFTLLTNQFSPEFGHSTGGQFNTTIIGGTNSFHGRAYEYFQNRNLNAIDAADARGAGPGFVNPRYDQNRFGGQIGGPILRDKLFFFSNFEKYQLGQSIATTVCAPTAAGFAAIAGAPGLNATNLGIFTKYTPVAPTQDAPAPNSVACPDDHITVGASNNVNVPVGPFSTSGPTFNNTYNSTSSIDYTKSETDQFRFRYLYSRAAFLDTAATLPVFYTSIPDRYHLFAFSYFHTFSPTLTNEFRLGYNRYSNQTPSGSFAFPHLDSFPNLVYQDLSSLQLGPDGNAPQSAIQNLYQAVDNITWVKGKHTLKFGFDGRKYISPQTFTQRERGDYEYSTLNLYLQDLSPDLLGERSAGNFIYYGDQTAFYGYGNDLWRITPTVTINYGLRYEFTSVPTGERAQALNQAASVPGFISFTAPQPQYKNFAPRLGVAWAPNQDTSIRLGFGMGYDVLYDNLGLLTFPPQYSSTQDVDLANQTPNFLTSGGLPPGNGGLQTFPSVAAQRRATSAYLPVNEQLPYSEQWNLGVQHVFAKNYTAEIRYVGTRGIHLPVQTQLNKQAAVTPSSFLPTFLGAVPDPATLASLPALSSLTPKYLEYVPAYAAAGFGKTGPTDTNTYSNITSYQPYGASNYNGLQAQLQRRFQQGLQFNAAYTYSKTMDNSTADVFSTILTPRRPQNFHNFNADYSRSALDHTHRITFETLWDIPYFKNSDHWLLKNGLGNWEIAPIYTYQSPEFADVQSGVDSNLNGDSAGDRAILNPNGVKGTGSGVTAVVDPARVALCPPNTDPTLPPAPCNADTVGYQAINPNAQYIRAQQGALATAGRNTLPIRPINNWDATATKRVNFTERYAFEFQAQAFNVFNHSQYVPDLISQINSNGFTSNRNGLIPGTSQFNQPQLIFRNNARSMQLVAKFIF